MSGWKLLLCAPAFLTIALGQEGALYPIVRKLKTGFIDRQGKVVIEPQFDGSTPERLGVFRATDPLYPVSKDLKWGYIDRTGAVKIPFQFSLAGKFSEGLAPVRVDSSVNGLWQSKFGYVDASGTLAIAAAFDQAGPFAEGLALVTTGALSGYIDRTGAFAIPARFTQLMDHTSTFSEGLAAVRLAPAPVVSTGEAGASAAAPDGMWGYIDRRGAWVIPARYRTASAFHDGVALVTDQSGYVYIRRSGEKAAGPYRAAWEFSGGLGRVEREDGAPAFITPGGEIAFTLPKSVLFVYPFSGGLARAWVREGDDGQGRDRYGYIDTKGQFAIPASYDGGTEFNDGLAFVAVCGQSGYIDAANRPVWGIKMPPARTTPIPAGLPSAAALSAAQLAELGGIAGGVTTRQSREMTPGACGPFGRPYWALEVQPRSAGSFPNFTLSLLEAGTYLSEERIETSAEMSRRFPGMSGFKAIGPAAGRPLGFVTVPGFGPGGTLFVTSVFSPDRRYEVQVILGQGEGVPRMAAADPVAWSERVAMGARALLFNQAAVGRTAPRPRAQR